VLAVLVKLLSASDSLTTAVLYLLT